VLSRTPADVQTTQPELGEHNQQILSELGFSLAEIEKLSAQKVI
jgi:crotonobetainyl-CoA:carnitine CoA-transferase CaiB-like acyl-CoA transferase